MGNPTGDRLAVRDGDHDVYREPLTKKSVASGPAPGGMLARVRDACAKRAGDKLKLDNVRCQHHDLRSH